MENYNNSSDNTNKTLKPKRIYKLRIYDSSEEPFNQVLAAAENGCSQMEYGKKYTFRQIVDLGDPCLWGLLKGNYVRRCMGASFATRYYLGKIDYVKMVNPDQSPIKYYKD